MRVEFFFSNFHCMKIPVKTDENMSSLRTRKVPGTYMLILRFPQISGKNKRELDTHAPFLNTFPKTVYLIETLVWP